MGQQYSALRTSALQIVLTVMLGIGLSAQSTPPGTTPETMANPSGPSQVGATVQDSATVKQAEYLLQTGDELEIRVYDLPELSAVLAIRPDGKIAIPLQPDLQAAGLTVTELTKAITAGYVKEFRNPRVTVMVRSFSNENVYVGGEVANAGYLPLKGQLTVFQAVFRAGGFKESARTDNVILIRNDGKGNPVISKLNLDELLKGKKDTRLQAFDVVYVPKTKIARADKFIDQHIRQLMPVSTSFGFSYILGEFVP